MKNHRRVLLLALCVCFLFSSCSNAFSRPLELYEVYVDKACLDLAYDELYGGIKYNDAKKTCSVPGYHSTKKGGVASKLLQLNAETVALTYNCTENKSFCEYNVHRYYNEEYNMIAAFHAETGNLEYLKLGTYQYRIYEGTIDSEDTLMETCANYLAQYVDDLDLYDSTVRTKIQTVDSHGVDNFSVAKYVSPSKYPDSTVSYEVAFTFYIGEIATSDLIIIKIDSEGYLSLVSFNMTGAFRDFADVEIDIARCNELISSEMSHLCSIEKYQYTGYTDSKILIVLNNQLCLVSVAQPTYESVNWRLQDILLIIPVSEK